MGKIGRVYLVGAGPGDPGLITVKGREWLGRADVVVYDHLVSERLLEACPPGAMIIYAGKEKGRHAKSQAQINRLIVRQATAGKTVVRLKGGDPVLFGRGGEEALALAKAGIPFEIVPGVTSAIAVPAYAGIPVTHRNVASSVAMITGHEDPMKSSSAIRWDRLATATDTLVCLMGVSTLPHIARQLIRHGRARSTPCAVIEWGTLPQQRTVVGTLGTIAAACRRAGLKPPAVVVVGEVVRLRRTLDWNARKPLAGWRIVVTRPTDRADHAAHLLEAQGAQVIRLPAIALAPISPNGRFHRAIDGIERFDWVFFTSPDGIRWFRRLLAGERKDLRVLAGRRIGAIGPKTAAAIEQHGIHVDFTPATFSQEGMLAGLAHRRRLTGRQALILSAQDSRDVLERGLRRQGMQVVRLPIYRTVMPATLQQETRAVFSQPVDLVTATSASCVEHLAQALRQAGLGGRLRRLRIASIGPVTSRAAREAGARVAVEARTSTMDGLADAILSAARRGRLKKAPR